MSPAWPASASAVTGFPRVSGDEPEGADSTPSPSMFSPRERG